MKQRLLALAGLVIVPLLLAGCLPITDPDGWATPLVVDGEIIVATREGRIVAVEEGTANERVVFPENPEERIGPVYGNFLLDADGVLYVGSFDGVFFSVDLATGRPIRRLELADPMVGDPLLLDEVVAFTTAGSDLGRVRTVTTDILEDIWASDVASGPIWAGLEAGGELLYVASLDRNVYAISREDGSVVWSVRGEGGLTATPLLADGTLFVGGLGRVFYALDPETGEERWRFEESETFYWARPTMEDGTVFAASVGGIVYALDAATGEQVWAQPYDAGADVMTDLLVFDETLVLGTDAGRVVALDTATGSERWSQALGEGYRVRAKAQVVDETLYVVAMRDRRIWIYTMDPANGAIRWSHQVTLN